MVEKKKGIVRFENAFFCALCMLVGVGLQKNTMKNQILLCLDGNLRRLFRSSRKLFTGVNLNPSKGALVPNKRGQL